MFNFKENITGKIIGPYICGDSIDFYGYEILIGSYSATNQMQIWDSRTLTLTSEIEWDEYNKAYNTNIYSAKFSPNRETFGIGCSNSNYVRIYNTNNDKNPTLISKALDKPIYSIDFSNNGKNIAFAGADNYIGIVQI